MTENATFHTPELLENIRTLEETEWKRVEQAEEDIRLDDVATERTLMEEFDHSSTEARRSMEEAIEHFKENDMPVITATQLKEGEGVRSRTKKDASARLKPIAVSLKQQFLSSEFLSSLR